MSFTIGSILPRCAARLNDPAQTIFTSDVMLPYAKDAADELQLELELNGLLVLEKKSPVIILPQTYTDLASHNLIPSDMLEPQRLEERLSGSTDLFVSMDRTMWEPEMLPTDSLRYWSYREENIEFVGATTDRDIKIFYLKRLISVADINSIVSVNDAQQFMINRIAAMTARYVGEDVERAISLDGTADKNLRQLIRIGVKSKQGTRTRRRPFILMGRGSWI